jgi:hypothetical protein
LSWHPMCVYVCAVCVLWVCVCAVDRSLAPSPPNSPFLPEVLGVRLPTARSSRARATFPFAASGPDGRARSAGQGWAGRRRRCVGPLLGTGYPCVAAAHAPCAALPAAYAIPPAGGSHGSGAGDGSRSASAVHASSETASPGASPASAVMDAADPVAGASGGCSPPSLCSLHVPPVTTVFSDKGRCVLSRLHTMFAGRARACNSLVGLSPAEVGPALLTSPRCPPACTVPAAVMRAQECVLHATRLQTLACGCAVRHSDPPSPLPGGAMHAGSSAPGTFAPRAPVP